MTHRHLGHPHRGLVLNPVNGQLGKVDQARVSQHFQAVGSSLLAGSILERLPTDEAYEDDFGEHGGSPVDSIYPSVAAP
jgi:hypothetical protein